MEIDVEERKGVLRTDPRHQPGHDQQNQPCRQPNRQDRTKSTAWGRRTDGGSRGHRGEASGGSAIRGSGLGVSSQLEDNVQIKRFAVTIPPALFTLMARAEIDLGAIWKGQLDLNHVIGATGCTLQWGNRCTSSPTHGYKGSHIHGHRMCISRSRRHPYPATGYGEARLRPFPVSRRACRCTGYDACPLPTSRRTSMGHEGIGYTNPCRT